MAKDFHHYVSFPNCVHLNRKKKVLILKRLIYFLCFFFFFFPLLFIFMLKYLNLAALLTSAKCYQNFTGLTWQIVWRLITWLFYTHNIIYKIQKERKMVFFVAPTLGKVSGLAEISFLCNEWYFNLGLNSGRIACPLISRSIPGLANHTYFLCFPKAWFHVRYSKGLLSSDAVQVGDLPSKCKECILHDLRVLFELAEELCISVFHLMGSAPSAGNWELYYHVGSQG